MLRLPDTDLATGYALAERLREGVEMQPIFLDRQTSIHVAMSSGIVWTESGLVASLPAASQYPDAGGEYPPAT